MDDVSDFKLTDDAMTHMGMTDAEKLAIYTIIAGVMHLGNVVFEENVDDTKGWSSGLGHACFPNMPGLKPGCGCATLSACNFLGPCARGSLTLLHTYNSSRHNMRLQPKY